MKQRPRIYYSDIQLLLGAQMISEYERLANEALDTPLGPFKTDAA